MVGAQASNCQAVLQIHVAIVRHGQPVEGPQDSGRQQAAHGKVEGWSQVVPYSVHLKHHSLTSRAAVAPSNSSWQVLSSTLRKLMGREFPAAGGNCGSACSTHKIPPSRSHTWNLWSRLQHSEI